MSDQNIQGQPEQAVSTPQASESLLGDSGATQQQGAVPQQRAQASPEPQQPQLPAFQAQLRKDLQGHEILSGVNNFSELTERLIETEGKLKNAVVVPGDDANEDDVKSFWSKLGTPETPDKYQLNLPANVRAEKSFKDLEENFRQIAHQAGLTQKQAEQVFNEQVRISAESIDKAVQARARAKDDAVKALKAEWGDRFDENLEKAKRALKKYAPESFVKYLDKQNLSNDPELIKVFTNIFDSIGEDSFVDSDGARWVGRATGGLYYPSMNTKS